jgi:hypothetical protein
MFALNPRSSTISMLEAPQWQPSNVSRTVKLSNRKSAASPHSSHCGRLGRITFSYGVQPFAKDRRMPMLIKSSNDLQLKAELTSIGLQCCPLSLVEHDRFLCSFISSSTPTPKDSEDPSPYFNASRLTRVLHFRDGEIVAALGLACTLCGSRTASHNAPIERDAPITSRRADNHRTALTWRCHLTRCLS